MNTEKLLRVKEVAEILRVSHMTIIRWCDSGHLPCVKIGVSRRIREADLEFILQSERGPQKLKSPVPEPVYTGLSAEELGFDSEEDEVIRQQELKEQCADARAKIEDMKAKQESTLAVVPVTNPFADYFKKQQSTCEVQSKYPSGFNTF